MKKTYLELGSVKAASKELGVSALTLSRELKTQGIVLTQGRKKGSKPINRHVHSGCLATWLKTHPGTPLPRSVSEISALTGCTPDEVKTYLYRRRYSEKKRFEKLPWLGSEGFLYDIDNKLTPRAAFLRVESITLDPFTFEGTVVIELRVGLRKTFKGPYDVFELALIPERVGRS